MISSPIWLWICFTLRQTFLQWLSTKITASVRYCMTFEARLVSFLHFCRELLRKTSSLIRPNVLRHLDVTLAEWLRRMPAKF
jgi:hypothetical protein